MGDWDGHGVGSVLGRGQLLETDTEPCVWLVGGDEIALRQGWHLDMGGGGLGCCPNRGLS